METGRVSDDTNDGGIYTAERLEAQIVSLERERDRRRPSDWTYGSSISSFLGDQEPDEDDTADWHMRGLVPRDVSFMIAGDPKTGKTMLVESWAISLAMGAPDWCGFPINGRKRVLLMPREDAERTTKIRLWQLARGAGLQRPHDLEKFLAVDVHNPLDLGTADHIRRLEAACDRFDVIFVDSFATSHRGDENSSRDMSSVMGAARDLSLGTLTAIGFIHHFNGKGGNADDKRSPIHRLRGSSAIAGYARHVVGVERGKEKGQVVIAADGNFEFKPESFVARLVNGDVNGKRTLRYELVGGARDVARETEEAAIEDAILLVIETEAGREGFTETQLRALVSEQLKQGQVLPDGVRGIRVSERAEYLRSQGRIDREISSKKRWRSL